MAQAGRGPGRGPGAVLAPRLGQRGWGWGARSHFGSVPLQREVFGYRGMYKHTECPPSTQRGQDWPHFLGLLFGQASLQGEAGAALGCLQGAAETCSWLVLQVCVTPKSHVQRLPSLVPFPHGCSFLFSKT